MATRAADAWRTAGDGAGYTIPAAPGTQPKRRIDYVFVAGELKVKSVSVRQHERTALASDHYPVKAVLEFR